MTVEADKIVSLQQTLAEQVRDDAWRKVLQILAVTGVADNQQLIQATGLNRDKLRRTLDKVTAAASGYPPLFHVYDRKFKRCGERGSPVRVYRLGESGAALCRADGWKDARPCQLEEGRAILHALGILDLYLAAQSAGLQVVTDRNISYGDGNFIRPDNLVTLSDGTPALFEAEQDARSDFLNRMLRSLAHKVAFFQSEAGDHFSPIIRMLIDLPRGKLWQQTVNTWSHAIQISRETHGDHLPFRLLAMPLSEFLARPDWSREPEDGRWVDVTQASVALVSTNDGTIQPSLPDVPAFSNRERYMILKALHQELIVNGVMENNRPEPDIAFLAIMRLIYVASHDPFAPASQRSGVPYESLYLLNQYLQMNPALRELVEHTTQMDARRIHWNQSTALHRMQVVVDQFLEFHGWQSNGPLRAYSYTPDYQAKGPRRLSVAVEITNPEILLPEETGIVPGKEEVAFLQSALAWVLTALFAATHHLGMKKPPFW